MDTIYSKFTSDLIVECIDDNAASGRGLWEIKQPFTYYSEILKKEITIESGFVTDYASVPRLPFAYWLLGDTAHKAAVVHDWLYHNHSVCDEDTANMIFLEACDTEHIPEWRYILLYLGVTIGGFKPWVKDGATKGDLVDGKIV